MPDLERLLKELFLALDADTQSHIAIIGGQALSIWAHHYLLDELTGEERACLASDDLDFLGRRPVIERCAQAWNTKLHVPEPFANVPNSGILYLDYDMSKRPLVDEQGNPAQVLVDFLPSVHGVPDKEVAKGLDTLVLAGFAPRLLTPALCLKSRLVNLHSLHYSDELVQREKVRIRLAAAATKCYLLDLLEDPENRRKALRWANIILEVSASPWCVGLAVTHELEPLAAIPEGHPGFGERFLTGHYAAMRDKTLVKRSAYRKRLLAMKPKDTATAVGEPTLRA